MLRLCRNLSTYIAATLSLDEDRRQVMEYGLVGLTQMLVILILSLLIGVPLHFAPEAVILFFGVGLLRRNTGGAHSQTLAGCTILSVLSICAMSALCRHVLIDLDSPWLLAALQLLCSLLSFSQVYRKVPMDSPNKPIVKPEKIKRLRRNSFLTVAICNLISIALFLWGGRRGISLGFSVNCAVLWQMFTLTRVGVLLIHVADNLFVRGTS